MNNQPFPLGAKVKCLKYHKKLPYATVYTVKGYRDHYVELKEVEGMWRPDRFILVSDVVEEHKDRIRTSIVDDVFMNTEFKNQLLESLGLELIQEKYSYTLILDKPLSANTVKDCIQFSFGATKVLEVLSNEDL